MSVSISDKTIVSQLVADFLSMTDLLGSDSDGADEILKTDNSYAAKYDQWMGMGNIERGVMLEKGGKFEVSKEEAERIDEGIDLEESEDSFQKFTFTNKELLLMIDPAASSLSSSPHSDVNSSLTISSIDGDEDSEKLYTTVWDDVKNSLLEVEDSLKDLSEDPHDQPVELSHKEEMVQHLTYGQLERKASPNQSMLN